MTQSIVPTMPIRISRRTFARVSAAAAASVIGPRCLQSAEPAKPVPFQFRYCLASSLYGKLPIAEVLSEVRRAGANVLDIWPEPHANHREQIEAMGRDRFRDLLLSRHLKVEIYTCYNPGLFKSEPWMRAVKYFGGSMIVTGSGGQKGLAGNELKDAVRKFAESIKPQLRIAAELGLKIAVENHSSSLLDSPESLALLLEAVPDEHLAIALAPYHLPQDPRLLADLIRSLGARLALFYAWEHGDGSARAMPKAQEMKQLPGFGALDFKPLVNALRDIRYQGWTSIFMHPFPRGLPILPTAPEVTAAINRSRAYLETC